MFCFHQIYQYRSSSVVCTVLLHYVVFLLSDSLWDYEKPKLLKLGVLPVKAMLAVEEHLWASSGGQVFIICTHTHCIQVQIPGLIQLTLSDQKCHRQHLKGTRALLFLRFIICRNNIDRINFLNDSPVCESSKFCS